MSTAAAGRAPTTGRSRRVRRSPSRRRRACRRRRRARSPARRVRVRGDAARRRAAAADRGGLRAHASGAVRRCGAPDQAGRAGRVVRPAASGRCAAVPAGGCRRARARRRSDAVCSRGKIRFMRALRRTTTGSSCGSGRRMSGLPPRRREGLRQRSQDKVRERGGDGTAGAQCPDRLSSRPRRARDRSSSWRPAVSG